MKRTQAFFCVLLTLYYPAELRQVRLWPADCDPLNMKTLVMAQGRLRFTTRNLYSN